MRTCQTQDAFTQNLCTTVTRADRSENIKLQVTLTLASGVKVCHARTDTLQVSLSPPGRLPVITLISGRLASRARLRCRVRDRGSQCHYFIVQRGRSRWSKHAYSTEHLNARNTGAPKMHSSHSPQQAPGNNETRQYWVTRSNEHGERKTSGRGLITIMQ